MSFFVGVYNSIAIKRHGSVKGGHRDEGEVL